MRNLLIGIFIGTLLGGAAGFAAGLFVFPYWFPPPEVNETVGDLRDDQVVASGTFVHADPSDSIHFGSGGVRLYDELLHIEANFEVGPGPKYHVYLVPDEYVTPQTDVAATMFVDLGRLKAFSGSQNYAIPTGTNLKDYGSVVVWCEQFGVLITPATIQHR